MTRIIAAHLTITFDEPIDEDEDGSDTIGQQFPLRAGADIVGTMSATTVTISPDRHTLHMDLDIDAAFPSLQADDDAYEDDPR